MGHNLCGTHGAKRTRGFPRVINAGHGIKLGAVVSHFVPYITMTSSLNLFLHS